MSFFRFTGGAGSSRRIFHIPRKKGVTSIHQKIVANYKFPVSGRGRGVGLMYLCNFILMRKNVGFARAHVTYAV